MAQHWFHVGDVGQDLCTLFGGFAEGVVGAALDALQYDVGRGAEQDDRVEALVETSLVGHCALHDQWSLTRSIQQLLDQRLPP